jgi:hypothetical protein
MVYIDRYIRIYKFKYVYVHIWESKIKKEKRDPLVSVGITNRDYGRRCWRAPPHLVSVRNTTED